MYFFGQQLRNLVINYTMIKTLRIAISKLSSSNLLPREEIFAEFEEENLRILRNLISRFFFCAEKLYFTIVFSDISKYNNSERIKIEFRGI